MKRILLACLSLPLLLDSGIAKAEGKVPPGISLKTGEVAYAKVLPGSQELIVRREDVPYTPPSEAELKAQEKTLADLQKQFPGARRVQVLPDRVSQYSMFLNSADGKSKNLIWQRTIPEYIKPFWGTPPSRRFFDILIEPETLVVLHAFGSGDLTGEVVKRNEPRIGNSFKPEWAMPVPIKVSVTIGTPFLKSASIEGSLAKGDLAVVAKKIDGDTARFLWKGGKWEEQKAIAPPMQPAAE